jgi:hypothetical protein
MNSRCSRLAPLALALAAAALFGCDRGDEDKSDSAERARREREGAAGAAAPRKLTEAEALRERTDLPPERRALVVVAGAERWVEAEAIEAVGYTLVDLRDSWTPLIFVEEKTPQGTILPNRYRRVFIGLTNDQLDGDGEPLEPDEKNYLELYGVFPSLSVLRARFVEDAARQCHDEASVAALEAVESVSYVAPKTFPREAARIAALRATLEAEQRSAALPTLRDLALSKPELAAKVKQVETWAAEQSAMAAAEKRLSCEGLLPAQSKHQVGLYDEAMQAAVRRFQHKHMIYEENLLRRRTVDALARQLLDNDYDALVRVLRERVVSATGVIEDGTAGTAKLPARNLVEDYTQSALAQLGLTDAQASLAFFQRHTPEQFQTLRAAVKLPPRPDYYAPHMDLSIVIDRGDVWYDLPFDDEGKFKYFPRKKYPTLTLLVTHGGKQIALARWRTTIGGWRAEQAPDGYEYYRYKGSDVGPRVLRQIVSGPVWIAPTSTPIRSLVKSKTINGRWMQLVNYDELGPGFLSAYGLVAGYFVVPGRNGRPDYDNGIRAHGSSNYLSIYTANGFSHGCHRLPNHIAIRLYSFILGHRHRSVAGDQPVHLTRQFLKDDIVFELKIPSRGYAYVLDPPLPVEVLEGQIKGTEKAPILGYVPKPDTEYPGPPPPAPDSPESKI